MTPAQRDMLKIGRQELKRAETRLDTVEAALRAFAGYKGSDDLQRAREHAVRHHSAAWALVDSLTRECALKT